MTIRSFFKLIMAIAAIFALSFAHLGAFAKCDEDVVGELPRGKDLFTYYGEKVDRFMANRKNVEERLSKKFVEQFWQVIWPELLTEAAANETTVAEMFEEPLLLMRMYISQLDVSPKDMRTMDANLSNLVNDLKGLQGLKPGGKLKGSHWEKIPRILSGLYAMSLVVYNLEYVTLSEPTFDPLAPMSTKHIFKLLESLDETVLDAMSLAAEESNRLLRESKQPKPNAPDSLKPEDNRAPEAPSHRDEVDLAEQVPQSISSQPEQLIAQPQVSPPVLSDDLYVTLKLGHPLEVTKVYRAKNPRGEEFSIQISPEIAEEYMNGERETVRKLLKSIVHGTGLKSGIKNLFDIGPGIIELKSVFHGRGHKRILGCLEGRRLRLLRYVALGNSLASYARRIPGDLCR